MSGRTVTRLVRSGEFDLPTFVKWAGGKGQLIAQYTRFFPSRIDTYLEPFLGGGAVYFYVRQRFNPRKAILSDVNAELINAFQVVKDNCDELASGLNKLREMHSKEHYYKTRKLDPSMLDRVDRAARLIYLNKTCYNGLYRVNSKGQFNVPFGDYKKPSVPNVKTLRKASLLLNDAELRVMTFEGVLDLAEKDGFVYFDPPYLPLSKTADFTAYNKETFGRDQQEKLAQVFRKLDARRCLVMLSNSDHEFVKNLYNTYRINTVKARRAISCVGTKRGTINEIVVTNYQSEGLSVFFQSP